MKRRLPEGTDRSNARFPTQGLLTVQSLSFDVGGSGCRVFSCSLGPVGDPSLRPNPLVIPIVRLRRFAVTAQGVDVGKAVVVPRTKRPDRQQIRERRRSRGGVRRNDGLTWITPIGTLLPGRSVQ